MNNIFDCIYRCTALIRDGAGEEYMSKYAEKKLELSYRAEKIPVGEDGIDHCPEKQKMPLSREGKLPM